MPLSTRISVRLDQNDIEWLQDTFGSTTLGIRAAVDLLRGSQSLMTILAERFDQGYGITLGALLTRVPLSYQQIFALLQRGREAKAVLFKMPRGARLDEDLAGVEIRRGPQFAAWHAEYSRRY